MDTEKRMMGPEKVITMLKKHNYEISVEDASAVIEFLYLLAEIYLNEGAEI